MSAFRDWLPALEAPAGGYRRLADALAARQRQQHRRLRRARYALAGASLAVAALVLAPLAVPPEPPSALIAASLQQAWADAEREFEISDGASLEVLRQPGLRVYWIDVDPAKASPSSTSPRPSR